jgi:hypothetical protein
MPLFYAEWKHETGKLTKSFITGPSISYMYDRQNPPLLFFME